MDFALDADQLAVQETFARFFTRESPASVVRDAESLGFSRDLWAAAGRLGATHIAVPEHVGGSGGTLLDAVVMLEEAGRALAPVPLADHLAAARAIACWGDDTAGTVCSGADVVALATLPADRPDPLVPAGAVARFMVALRGHELLLVDGEAPGAALANLGGLPLARRSIDPADANVTVLTAGETAIDAFARALDECRVLTAAALVGLADRALEIGVDYAKERRQFNQPIGAFQSVQHGLAELPGPVNGARLLVRKAAWALDHDDPDAPRLCRMAYPFASETAQQVCAASLHYHGGYGFMDEYDIGLYYRRAKAWSLLLGDPGDQMQRLADTVLGPVGA